MNRGNYTSKLIGHLDRMGQGELRPAMEAAPVFALPEMGYVLGEPKQGELLHYPKILRLPFLIVNLEYIRWGIPCVILAVEKNRLLSEQQAEQAVWFALFCRRGDGHWAALLSTQMLVDQGATLPRALTKIIDPSWKQMLQDASPEARLHETTAPGQVLCQFLSALECKNVAIEDEPVDPKLQKSRRLRGKPPLKDYKVLTLKAGPRVIRRGAGDPVSHASPRMHLRRGHIRRLPNGNVWVNSTVVNPEATERLDKSYRVTA